MIFYKFFGGWFQKLVRRRIFGKTGKRVKRVFFTFFGIGKNFPFWLSFKEKDMEAF